ncbi:hypothetical protein QW060_18020 [Myroides ceti]|uniref:Uncharacterized protein n=1 Tax=Paenimyroides ceti TaxID=395087 RepID=A0ABT8CXP4_9FLAO|nr:hypothetical protein [Paenimyroides ceti]MDN3708974.1 hypothetical protein [Paenimyroides ceti]
MNGDIIACILPGTRFCKLIKKTFRILIIIAIFTITNSFRNSYAHP